MMKFEAKMEYDGIFLPNHRVYLGVKKRGNLLAPDYDAPLKRIGGGVTVNPKIRGKYWQDELGRTRLVSESWLSVWDNSPIQKFFMKLLDEKADILVTVWFGNKEADPSDFKKATNSIRAIYMQAYVAMSKWFTVTQLRGNIKRFNDYGIDTGETMEATAVILEANDD